LRQAKAKESEDGKLFMLAPKGMVIFYLRSRGAGRSWGS
jgi:hypothetical protein